MNKKITSFLQWLHANPMLNFGIAFFYFLLVVLPHEQVGLWTIEIFGHLSRDTYNAIILGLGLLLLGIYLGLVLEGLRSHPARQKLGFYLVVTILLTTIAFNFLIVINIEIIHFIQYALMAILVFPLIGRWLETLGWVTLLGAIDEAYQYFYLAPDRTDYYDFNDVIINLLGGVFGLIFLKISIQKLTEKIPPQAKTFRYLGLILFLLILLVGSMWGFGILDIYPIEGEKEAIFLLMKEVPSEFWTVIHPNVTYHIIRPWEGVILIGLLLIFYSKIK